MTTTRPLKILLVEDQAMLLGALATLLSLESGIEQVVTARNAEEALIQLKNDQFDMLISDIEMPGKSGLELCELVAMAFPQMKRVIITTFRRAGYVKRAIEQKVDGFLLKDSPPEKFINCIYAVQRGKRVIDPELLLESLDVIDLLSLKERQALKLAQQGKSNREIAETLFLSLGTVKNYISSCMAKLGANNRIEAIRIADKRGLL